MNKLPGDKAKAIIEEDKKFVSPSYTREYPIVVDKGEGCYIFDVDGNKFLDFTSGVAVCNTGHCHPAVVRAIEEQAEKFIHFAGCDFYYPQIVNLAKKLSEITPGSPNKRVFFCNSGAESIECAIKLARYHTKRKNILAFYNSFHGRTYGAMSLTASKSVQREDFDPLVPGVFHIPYPYCYRCMFNLKYPSCNFACIQYIEDVIFNTVVSPTDVAALFAEPIQGEGGYIVPPDDYFLKLKELLNKYGILFVVDEVQTGMGRTGKMFGIEHYKVIPDIICIAKGLASGIPIGATVSFRNIMDWPKGAHASTFGGNPLGCEAALTTIKLLEEGLIERAKTMGEYFINQLKDIAKDSEIIGDVRGKGLMLACEIVKDKNSKEKNVEDRNKIINKCFFNGLLILGCGQNVIRFIPPLIVKKEEIDKALEIFSSVLKTI